MKPLRTPNATDARVTVRAINFELEESVQTLATEKAARLLRLNPSIQLICIELENDPTTDPSHEYIGKGKIDFGGPALLTSVTGGSVAATIDYLLEQLEHRLRKQSRIRAAAVHPPPTRAGSRPTVRASGFTA